MTKYRINENTNERSMILAWSMESAIRDTSSLLPNPCVRISTGVGDVMQEVEQCLWKVKTRSPTDLAEDPSARVDTSAWIR